MAKLIKAQNSFTSGEISPKLLARTDLTSYENSCKSITNAYPMVHGGIKRRPGTVYVGEVYNSAEQTRLVPFVYSKDLSYVLVFNGDRIEFIKNGEYIMNGASRYYIASPYAESDLTDLAFAQTGNALYIASGDNAPRILLRTTDVSWSLSPIAFTYRALSDQWYETDYIKFKILSGVEQFAVGDVFTITVSGGVVTGTTGPTPAGTNKGIIFGSAVTQTAVNQTWTITCLISGETRQEWIVSGSVSGTPTLTWQTNNYPRAVGFFEQRVYFASTPNDPQTVWGSAVGDFANFTLGPNDNDAVQFTFASNRYDQIVHLESARQLIPMTTGSEFSMVGGTGGITPSAVRIRANTFHGTAPTKPARISQEVVFVQRDRKKLRAISYSVAEDVNTASDLTLFAEHITGTGVIDMSFAQDPDYLLWVTRDDGYLLSMSHLREQAVTAWAKHVTDGSFEKCATVPDADSDITYLVVKRTIGGVVKRFIEYIDYVDVPVTDCSLTQLYGSPTTSVTGLTYLNGKTVDVIADGIPQTQKVVSGGTITLDKAATVVEVGLPFRTSIEVIPPHMDLGDGSMHFRPMTVPEIHIRFHETTACTVNGYTVPFRTTLTPLSDPTPPFTGDKKITSLGWNVSQPILIEQNAPAPLTILGIALKIIVPDLTE